MGLNNKQLPYPTEAITIESSVGSKYIGDVIQQTKRLAFANMLKIEKELIIQILQNTVNTVQYKDEETSGHMNRLGVLSEFLGELMSQNELYKNLDSNYTQYLGLTAPLHDIGKLGIPLSILTKPGALTPNEYNVIKTHSIIGRQIIEQIRQIIGKGPILKMAQNISLYHHEKYDGSGYPYGLKGDKIPLSARIVGIIDIIDVLKSIRVYKRISYSNQHVKRIIEGEKGKHFDPHITDVVLKNLDTILELRNSMREIK